MTELRPGSVVWVQLDPTVGREQRGTRPAVAMASRAYIRAVPDLMIVVPATTRDRRWPHHVRLAGTNLRLPKPTWAMTEQPRAISLQRVTGAAGHVDSECLRQLSRWLDDFLYRPRSVT
ncbi:type II toxin-antitoxin system PemK/MazF family toxin [Mycobacterium intracellulare]|uniref:type II toxin-antitoxin system PemK/MazF family toxin n=1 Tax=Mycobacterium intracellulare TaxID=1767 RepID=UPI0006CA818E|nr:type II toxin-antitoxin system PemK/MazF family toxin [Mycobacterium intracellulare]KPN48319.1 growth inhibitor PemK [Mycobacterium intracellulare subsp. chimaera]